MPHLHRAEPIGAVTLGRVLLFGGSAWLLGSALSVWIGKPLADTVPATLHAKSQSVVVTHPARLAELHVTTGQQVEPAAPLFRLTDERLSARITAKRQQIAELAAEVNQAEATAEVDLEWRRHELQREAFETRLKAAQVREAHVHHQVEQIAWEEHLTVLDRWLGDISADHDVQPLLLPADTIHPARLQALLRADESASTLEADAAQIALCQEKLSELVALEAKLTQKVRISAGGDVATARLQHAQAELEALELQEQALTLLSPGYGTVGSLTVQAGDAVSAGQCVIELLDGDHRFLIAHVPSALVGRFRIDEKVLILFPQQQRREGTVIEIPPQAQAAADGDDALIPVRIVPSGKLWPNLPVGSRVAVELPRR